MDKWNSNDPSKVNPFRLLGSRPPPLDRCGTCERPLAEGGGDTRDHIIPKGWLTTSSRRNIGTWRTCWSCNHEWSPREDRLRSIFVRARSHHAGLAKEVEETATRSTARVPDSPGWAEAPHGLLVPVRWVAAGQLDLNLVFRKIVRGLHWWEHGELPPKWPVQASVLTPEVFAALSAVVPSRTYRLGHEVWRRHPTTDAPGELWLFVLYGAVGVGVFCGAAAGMAPPSRPVAHVKS